MNTLVLNQTKSVLENLFFPEEIKTHILQIDIFDNNSLFYLEKLDAFSIMETNIMDRILTEFWTSEYDSEGSFFGASTAYNII